MAFSVNIYKSLSAAGRACKKRCKDEKRQKIRCFHKEPRFHMGVRFALRIELLASRAARGREKEALLP